ncbi:hypothetical protein [Lacticaseibacillus sp. GG6-2]
MSVYLSQAINVYEAVHAMSPNLTVAFYPEYINAIGEHADAMLKVFERHGDQVKMLWSTTHGARLIRDPFDPFADVNPFAKASQPVGADPKLAQVADVAAVASRKDLVESYMPPAATGDAAAPIWLDQVGRDDLLRQINHNDAVIDDRMAALQLGDFFALDDFKAVLCAYAKRPDDQVPEAFTLTLWPGSDVAKACVSDFDAKVAKTAARLVFEEEDLPAEQPMIRIRAEEYQVYLVQVHDVWTVRFVGSAGLYRELGLLEELEHHSHEMALIPGGGIHLAGYWGPDDDDWDD